MTNLSALSFKLVKLTKVYALERNLSRLKLLSQCADMAPVGQIMAHSQVTLQLLMCCKNVAEPTTNRVSIVVELQRQEVTGFRHLPMDGL